ncbi:MAG: hypothetical protein NTX76_03685 [Alphaproteobacteria bacterium]|nr:hypothetical protein [Alphaproteobacteria bacterium]
MDRAISETLYKLDSERLSELIIASILTNPEDGRGSNIIVADCSSDNPYAVTIDNDHSLGPAEYLKTGDKSTCLRSVLFDLPQMGDPLHENVRKRLMELDPCEFLKEWLTDLKNEDEYQRNLMLDPSSIGIYSANKTLLGILLSRQSLENIQRKFLGIRFYLKTENMLTHKELVFALEPSIRNRFIKKYYEYAGYDDHGKTAMSGHDLIEKAHEEFYLNIDEALDRLKNFCRFYHIYFHNFKLIDREQNKLNNIKRIRVVKRSDSAYAAHNPPPWFPRNELFFCEESNLLEYIGEDEDKKEKIESLCKDFKDTDSVISDTCHQTQNSQTTTWLSLILPQNRLAELNICGRLDEKAISLLMISWEGPNSIAATNFLSALDPTKLTTLIMCGRLDEKAISLLCNILSSPDYKLTKLGLFVNHETPGVVVVFDSSHDPLCGDYAVYSYFRRKDATLHHDKDDRTAINSRFIDALCEPHCSVTTLSFRDSQFFEHKFPFHCLHKTKLTTLDYSYSCISESDVEDLADALMNPNCHLTSLNLSHNGIKKLSSCLFDALSSPKCRLTSLNLSHNSIEDKDAESLFEILPRTKRVKLVLSDNKISDDYMRKIRERLMCNAMQKEKCNEPTDSPCTVS